MNISTAQAKQDELHATATRLLADKDIENLLSKYGDPKFVGSYAAKLMVKPDIDMEIVNPNIINDDVIELTSTFFKMKDNYSVEIADGTEYIRRPGHPKGYFIGVNIMYEEVRWHLDIWITHEPIDTSNSNYVSLRKQEWYKEIDKDLLDTILLVKHQLNATSEYSKYASANVYESVLSGGVKSIDDFYKWAEIYDTEALFQRGKSRAT
ncbi:MAG: hypothetical protein AAB914_03880 [Patescibacteria group bacterium]